MNSYVLGLSDADAGSLPLVGGKGANLGELLRIGGIAVPDGFCVTTRAYADVVCGDPEIAVLLDALGSAAPGDADGVRAISARLRGLIEAAPVPDAVASAIAGEMARRGAEDGYAVRSSATAEDLPGASFAGQQETFLNVVGAASVVDAVRRCWASLFTDRAVSYRAQEGIAHREVELAVVVQRMVDADVAGVLFTADPVTGDRRVVAIEAVRGLGEVLVSGASDADHYAVRDDRIVEARTRTQRVALRPGSGGGTAERALDGVRATASKLTDAEIRALARLGRTIEAHFGRPQDVEWCLAGGEFWVVQARPITTLFPIPGVRDGKNHVYMSFGHQQMMTDAMKPLGLSFFQSQLGETPLVEAGGRLYIDMAPDLASPVGRQLALASMKAIDPLIDSAIRSLLGRRDFMMNLAADGPRYLSLSNNAGYFTWRLPVEAVKAYRRADPGDVVALKAEHDASLAALQARLAGLTGDELFDGVLDDLRTSMKDDVAGPRGMGIVYVGMYALSWVNKHMEKWLGVKGAADTLVQLVTDDVTAEMGRALLAVADVVRGRPAVMEALPTLPREGFLAALTAVEGGEDAARALGDFLAVYGARCPGEIDITRTRWNEDPSALVPMILSSIPKLDADGHDGGIERGRREAEELERSLLERLERLPGGRRKAEQTRKMVDRIRTFAGYREYPKYLMMRHYWVIKQALLAEASRLVERGVLGRPEDVHYLSFDEFREAVRAGCVEPGLIERRRQEFAHSARLTPPRLITSDGEVLTGTYGGKGVPSGALPGIAASSGVVEGRARVILSLGEAYLSDGDILVTTFTDPSWTPAFLAANGIVTEVGGAMTHGAVVAREYGLPAVVGVEGATRLIVDGQRIRVNGSEGYVEVL